MDYEPWTMDAFMKARSFLESLNNAADGIVYAVKHERNMRVHFLLALFVLLYAAFIGVRRVEWMILCVTVSLVIVTEILNTAIEEIVDVIFKDSYSHTAKTIKHVSAGAVLAAACNALIVGFFIFFRYLSDPFGALAHEVRYSSPYATFISILVVVFLVVWGKALFKKKGHKSSAFRGGAVSGHAAVAFSLWTVILFTQDNAFVVAVSFLLAALVAQSRLRAKIHSFWEVFAGALVGIFVTALFFKIFK